MFLLVHLLLNLIHSNIFFSNKIGQYQILELKYQSVDNYHIFMGGLFVLISQNRNLTPHKISFQVRNGLGPVPGLCPVPDLEPHSTRIVKQHRILRYCRRHADGLNWTISVFSAGEYTGVELTSDHLLFNTRLVFRRVTNADGRNVLRVDGVPENCTDNLLRHRYFGFGCLRNIIWDKRPTVFIGQEDSQAATKLRKMEAPLDQVAGPLTSTPLQQGKMEAPLGQVASPLTSKPLQRGSDVPNPSNTGKLNSDRRHVTSKVGASKHYEALTHRRTKEQTIPAVDSRPSLPLSSSSEKGNKNHMDSFVHGIVFLLALVIVFLVRAVTR